MPSLLTRGLLLRLQISGMAVSRNIRPGEGGLILNLIEENPADRAIGTSQFQPLIICTLIAIDGRLHLRRFFVQILTRFIDRVIEPNQKRPLSKAGEILPLVAFLKLDGCIDTIRSARKINGKARVNLICLDFSE